MVVESKTISPRWRQNSINSPQNKKQQTRLGELGSFSTIVHRHRFLLTACALLAFLCTIYLYLAVTFVANDSCSALSGTQKSMCHIQQAKDFVSKGKLRNLL
ncbi:hypothetical protein DCAR_0624915 [Daucus carota subsp. sativus]|uniref:Uncharacterized protein n=1 Tax=Daucus carota subsp. sativus TaxID=79200 RepID=A0AAF1B5K9_DAUCS|nr:hypothetical protein DCAR_0624915 [Daucus carota subsp. sativus]